ncbi:MAG: YnbE family lipoprotein [Nitrosomonas sp.]|nr:MAG: YnbE family lipoprotein [Nitrosomonas sp.]HMU64324.1 YnbE family lipoprotein [Nitrosomonas sp.]HMV12003.1 YnbE family lipoprotein [Nitrosomonas sp.]HMW20863.1 YnbE family lipoprotein [Nitrosomonas sp.]HMW68514.1 YnbE family lipoprotein [Nitrosomonas sp.]
MHNIIRLGDQVLAVASLSLFVMMIVACTPTVKVESPQEPITINLNIKLDADIRVKLEEEAKKDIAANPDVF